MAPAPPSHGRPGAARAAQVRAAERGRGAPERANAGPGPVTEAEGGAAAVDQLTVQAILALPRQGGTGVTAGAAAARPSAVMQLQASAGNAAVASLLNGAITGFGPSRRPGARATAQRAPAPADVEDRPTGPEDTKSVEGDTDRSEFTDLPAKAESELAQVPAKLDKPPAKVEPPAKPKPPAPKGKKKIKRPTKGPRTGPKGRRPRGRGPKPAPAGGARPRAPPLPPKYSFSKGTLPPPAPVPVPYPNLANPAFKKMLGKKKRAVAGARKHPSAKAESANAQGAAAPPANDSQAQAKGAHAATMATAKPQPFDEDAFVAAVEAAIARAAPRNLDEAGNLGKKASGMKDAIAGTVSSAKSDAAGDVEEKKSQPLDPSKAVQKPVEPLSETKIPQPSPVGAAAAMPRPVPNELIDMRHGPATVDNEMVEAEISEKQLAESNEPEFTGALDAKKEATEHANAVPGKVRAAEAKELTKASGAATAAEQSALTKATAKIGAVEGGVGAKKTDAKARDEKARKEVADRVNAIYEQTKVDVDKILTGLSARVDQQFTAGEARVRALFTADWKRRLGEYKSRRYSGLRGKWRWARDKFRGLPAAANDLFAKSREVYEQHMKALVRQIAKTVSAELQRATARIEAGRKEISDYVGSLKGSLAKVGQEAAADIAEKFDDLDSSVKDTFDELANDLGKRAAESSEAVSAEIKAAQEENKGLIDKAIDKVKGVINTIRNLKDMLLNILAKISDVVTRIIASPIKFLKNFVTAVKAGVQRFAARIGDHLQKGLMGWLLGKLATAGVEIPDSFDVKSMLKLVLSVLGLGLGALREKFVTRIGGPAFAHLEKGASIVGTLMSKGPMAIIDQILEKFGDFEDMVLGKIKEFVVEKIVRSGIEFIVGLLNPAAAFIKACKMIYQVVMFFVDRGSEIKEFVESIIDAAGDIARGGMGGVPEKIEGVLARVLPLAISFLASLLNLGAVGKKIQEIIGRVTKPIHKAVDKVIDGILKLTKPIWGPIAKAYKKGVGLYEKGRAKAKDLYEKGKAKAKAAYEKGKAKVAKGVEKVKGKVKGWFTRQEKPFDMSGKSHTLIAEGTKAGKVAIKMRSVEELLSTKITRAIKAVKARHPAGPPDDVKAQIAQLEDIRALAQLLEEKAAQEGKSQVTASGAPPGFAKEMAELAKRLSDHAKRNGLQDIMVATAGAVTVNLELLGRFGVSMPAYLQVQEVADANDAIIEIRPTTGNAAELYEAEAAKPKEEKIKAKTINETDVDLGAPAQHLGKAAWFLPERPSPKVLENLGRDADGRRKAEKMQARYLVRLMEYKELGADFRAKIKEGELGILQEFGEGRGGVLKDAVDGLPYSGDYDIYRIVASSKKKVLNLLKQPPFRVQHGAHLDWPDLRKVKKKGGLNRMEQFIYDVIVRSHAPGGEALLRINPKAPPTAVSSETMMDATPTGQQAAPPMQVVKARSPGMAGLKEAEIELAGGAQGTPTPAEGGDPASRKVKEKAAVAVLEKTGGGTAASEAELKKAVSETRKELKGEGLDDLRAQPAGSKTDEFDIVGKASPTSKLATVKVAASGPRIDRAEVKALVDSAKRELANARREFARGGDDRATIASGGGTTRRQGGGSLEDAQRDPAAARRWLEADSAKWEGLGKLTKAHFTEMTTLKPGRSKDSTKMTDFHYPAATAEEREAHFEKTKEYVPRRHAYDAGSPGKTALVHAEKLLRQATGAAAIGVSRTQCGDCKLWFRAAALEAKALIVVADPDGVNVFTPAGELKRPADLTGKGRRA